MLEFIGAVISLVLLIVFFVQLFKIKNAILEGNKIQERILAAISGAQTPSQPGDGREEAPVAEPIKRNRFTYSEELRDLTEEESALLRFYGVDAVKRERERAKNAGE